MVPIRRVGPFAAALALSALLSACVPGGGPPPTPPPYPIVLAHGALGMESYGALDYWFGIVPPLQNAGATVYVTEVSAIHSSVVRGEQLLAQVQQIVATSGFPRVNLIGHSQGGIDARYVAGVRPDLVASVTTIGSPHKGAELAEFIAAGIRDDGSFTSALVGAFGSSIGAILSLLTGTDLPLDARAALLQLAPSGMAAFNAQFPAGVPADCGEGSPQVGAVRYFSWMGRTPLTNSLDPSDGLVGLAGAVYLLTPNDGLVSVCSAQFGDVIRNSYLMNHLDEVNQILGLVQLFETNPKTLFVNHVTRLRNLGL